jgi:hypothetical protein
MSRSIPDPQKIICLLCKDVIYSKYYGQFVSCKCGKLAIDESMYYCRILGNRENYDEVQIEEGTSD